MAYDVCDGRPGQLLEVESPQYDVLMPQVCWQV